MTLIPATVRHPEMTLAPDYGFPSGRRQHKTMKQIVLEAEWRRGLPRAIVVEAGRYVALGARIVGLLTLILTGFIADSIGSIFSEAANSCERLCNRLTKSAPPPPWLR